MPVHPWRVCFGYHDDVNVDAEEQPAVMVLFRIRCFFFFFLREMVNIHVYIHHEPTFTKRDDGDLLLFLFFAQISRRT